MYSSVYLYVCLNLNFYLLVSPVPASAASDNSDSNLPLSTTQPRIDTCPHVLAGENSRSNSDMLSSLARRCAYDRWSRPGQSSVPLQVNARIYVYFLGSIEAHNLQFTAHILVRFRWKDERLAFRDVAPDVTRVVGEESLRGLLWLPHVYLVNEHESKLMGADKQDILLSVKPDGTVLYSTRLKVTLFCLMNLQKFPFDQQDCPIVLESWAYNISELILDWEPDKPVVVNENLHLTEYSLVDTSYNTSNASYSRTGESIFGSQTQFGKFEGSFSIITVDFRLAREVGHYIMDYYVPSIFLVVVSWVSFWLDPNAVPGRTTLGSSTMLAFITLSRGISNSLPKVSYIKATEIWFIVCTAFIFGSLVEFAFVNTIWRRKHIVELKKVNVKHILRSTLTPQLHRRQIYDSGRLDRCDSWPSELDDKTNDIFTFTNEMYVKESSSSLGMGEDCETVVIPVPSTTNPHSPNAQSHGHGHGHGHGHSHSKTNTSKPFTTMTPQEVANWIDRRSRVAFPASFTLFNIFYWGFVWM